MRQVQLGDVFAGQTVDVVSGDPVVSQAVAAGNTASSIAPDPGQNYVGSQALSGAVSADAVAAASQGAGQLLQGTSSATGNTATVGACCGTVQGLSTQTVDASSSVSVETEVRGQGPTQQVSADATAIGDTQGYESSGAYIGTQTVQQTSGVIDAQTVATVGDVQGPSGYSATSLANDVTATSDTGLVALVTRQTADATAPSSATLTVQQDGGDTIQGQATATGNNLNAVSGGTVSLDSQQANAGDVTASADLAAGGWNSASVGAYGVGNSILADGSGVLANSSQTNTGAVSASAQLSGGAGGESYVNATAVGNALQGYACSGCGGVNATAQQTNSGGVAAVGRLAGPGGGAALGAASAIGNTATFTVKSSS